MNVSRFRHTATLLNNGKVLVTGGEQSFSGPGTASAELYDPTTGMWNLTGSMSTIRESHTATLLATGMVLVTGGIGPFSILSSAELYDPAAGTWSLTGSMLHGREFHSATLLANGLVLVAGGRGIQHRKLIAFRFAELYNPNTRTWAPAGLMNSAHFFHTAIRVGHKVLIAGGFDTVSGSPTAIAELYDPVTKSWALTGSMNDARANHTATQLSSSKILVTDGSGISGNLASAEIFQ